MTKKSLYIALKLSRSCVKNFNGAFELGFDYVCLSFFLEKCFL